ncbi:hypothetical protein BG006_002440 [Podila minutissima]|uniref:PAS domain-containing protein n=1 Tax=Podila minutissima TaxID=64525 RepID=A0A9P5SSD2_9FUNG|nr:hypothetical protein BG006_002440 [Podila minutissima]
MEPEARACMILNRFSLNLGIMYASPSCEFIFKVDPEAIVGKPFLLFVRADDLGPFVEQANMAKSKNVITNLRFYFQSPNWPQEIPCEIMAIGTSDGIIVILRSRPTWNPLRSIPIGSINSIRNMDHEDKLRPLTELLPYDPENVEEGEGGISVSPEQYGMRKHIREYEEDVDD